MTMQVRDVMTRNVISVAPGQSVLEAARLMLNNRISGLPVLDASGNLVGIVTEGDFLRRGELGTQRQRPKWVEFLIGPGRLADEYVRSAGRKVEEVMTPDPCTVTEDDTLATVVGLMERRQVKRLPVLRDGHLVGIVSRANLMDALTEFVRSNHGPAPDDGSIRDRIRTALADARWAPNIQVTVKNGVVELSGIIMDERERRGVIVAAENVAGVKAVHDHLVWVEPISGTTFSSPEDENAARTEERAEEAR
jgi:CBS-domain-containing membrane protein